WEGGGGGGGECGADDRDGMARKRMAMRLVQQNGLEERRGQDAAVRPMLRRLRVEAAAITRRSVEVRRRAGAEAFPHEGLLRGPAWIGGDPAGRLRGGRLPLPLGGRGVGGPERDKGREPTNPPL